MDASTPAAQPTGNLEISISTAHKPVRQDKTFSYRVQVVNRASEPDSNVMVQVAFPSGLTPQVWRTIAPTGTRFVILDNKVLFDAIPTLVAGDHVDYTIRVKAGDASNEELVVRAEVMSDNHPVPVSMEDTIRVSAF